MMYKLFAVRRAQNAPEAQLGRAAGNPNAPASAPDRLKHFGATCPNPTCSGPRFGCARWRIHGFQSFSLSIRHHAVQIMPSANLAVVLAPTSVISGFSCVPPHSEEQNEYPLNAIMSL